MFYGYYCWNEMFIHVFVTSSFFGVFEFQFSFETPWIHKIKSLWLIV